MIDLRGITWDHARGYDPLVAASRRYRELNPEISITWERRSLQAFGDMPLSRLADRYDLMVIDHPHIGEATAQGLLVALDMPEREPELLDLAAHGIGQSHESYRMSGRQWALAIDAAAQVSARRADLLPKAPQSWADVVALAEAGLVIWPLKPVDAVDSFFTLAANIGQPVAERDDRLIDEAAGLAVLHAMREVARYLPEDCFGWSPIDVLDALSGDQRRYAYAPLLFGYTNYARAGFRPHLVAFGDIPALGEDGPVGSILGGTGIAVSASSQYPSEAAAFSYWLASGSVQAGLYVAGNGQPAHAAAWNDAAADELCGGFFSGTRRTLDKSWLRPRYAGFLSLADVGGDLVNAFVRGGISAGDTLHGLEASYAASLAAERA